MTIQHPFEMIRFASMNGTLLFRRSASIVLLSSSLAVGACGVELNGLFQGDGGEDAPPRDAGQDAGSMADRGSDVRVDTPIDRSATDGPAVDGIGGGDATVDFGSGGDATRDPSFDPDARSDPPFDGNVVTEASFDADAARDISFDGDGARDVGTDPIEDPTAEDAAAEPRLDVAVERPVDAVPDTPPDSASDGSDAEPPISCTGNCNTFANISQTITRTVDSDPTPTMTGGNLVDGTYVVTAIVHYNGDMSPFSLAETSVIAGNFDAWVASTNGNPEVRYTTTFTTTNNQLAFSFCCPTAFNLTILYTTDGNTISHIDPGNPNRVITYTRQ